MISKTEGAFGNFELDEVSLLALKAKNDRSVIPELWEKVYRRIIGYCNHFWYANPNIKGRCELDDLVQESYLFFEIAIQNYRTDKETQFSTYLYLHLKRACRSASFGLTKRQQNDPIFQSESLDAPVKEGEEATIGDLIPDEESDKAFDEANDTEAVTMILNEVQKINGNMNKYCFLEYAYKNRSMSQIARAAHVSPTAIQNHVRVAANQLRKSPAIKEAYPEWYERTRYYIPDYATKSAGAFNTTGTSIVEDIVNRRLKIDGLFKKDAEMEKQHED